MAQNCYQTSKRLLKTSMWVWVTRFSAKGITVTGWKSRSVHWLQSRLSSSGHVLERRGRDVVKHCFHLMHCNKTATAAAKYKSSMSNTSSSSSSSMIMKHVLEPQGWDVVKHCFHFLATTALRYWHWNFYVPHPPVNLRIACRLT